MKCRICPISKFPFSAEKRDPDLSFYFVAGAPGGNDGVGVVSGGRVCVPGVGVIAGGVAPGCGCAGGFGAAAGVVAAGTPPDLLKFSFRRSEGPIV